MFTISVGHLLGSFTGDNEILQFEGEIPPGFYEDLEIIGPLKFELTLIAIDEGIEAIFRNFEANVKYEGRDEIVLITEVSRTFSTKFDPLAPDDIRMVDVKHSTIDLGPVVREEILMAVM